METKFLSPEESDSSLRLRKCGGYLDADVVDVPALLCIEVDEPVVFQACRWLRDYIRCFFGLLQFSALAKAGRDQASSEKELLATAYISVVFCGRFRGFISQLIWK